MKKFLLFSLILVLSLGSAAFAADVPSNYSEVPTEGVPANGNKASITFYPSDNSEGFGLFSVKKSNSLIDEGSAEIEYDSESGKLLGYGRTTAAHTSDEVGYALWFQEWNGEYWENIHREPYTKTKYNALVCSGFESHKPSSAKYFRVKVKCIVTDNGVTSFLDGCSPYIKR